MDDKLKNSSNIRKRPEMVYYRPGMMSKMSKKYYSYPDNSKHHYDSCDSDAGADSRNYHHNKYSNSKKPDKQVYQPKGRPLDEKKLVEKPKEIDSEFEKAFESIPDFAFENKKLSRVEEEKKPNKASHFNASHDSDKFQRKPKPKMEVSNTVRKNKPVSDKDTVDSVPSLVEQTRNLNLDAVQTHKQEQPGEVKNRSQDSRGAESTEKGDFRLKTFKQSHYLPGKPKKFPPKPEHYKYEVTLPPRFQKKLQMEKANQSQAAQYVEPDASRCSQSQVHQNPQPHRTHHHTQHSHAQQQQQQQQQQQLQQQQQPQQHNQLHNQHHQQQQQQQRHLHQQPQHHQSEIQNSNINRGGLIRLPASSQSVIATMASMSSSYCKPTYMHQQENTQATFDGFRQRQYGVIPPRQLFNPYHTNKPCVVIRPTYQTVMSHSNPRPPMTLANDTQIPSPNTDVTNLHHWAHSYLHDQQQLAASNHMPFHNYPYPVVPPYGTGVAGLLALPKESMSAFDSSSLGRKKLKPVVEKNMKEVINLEKELQLQIARSSDADEQLINQIRWKIQLRYEHVILTDPKFCAENNVEQMLWKSVYYQFIEMHRREIDENNREDSKEKLNKLIEEATTFFENLLVNLQDKFEFSVEQYIEHEYDPEMPNYDVIKLVAISAQKIYLYLGDIARYKEQASNTSNFGKARSCYMKAQQLAPKNGRPYNQLALLAMYGKRKLDAVYYYMRSLAASNPFQSARENLLGIFDEVRRKYENAEQKRLEEQRNKKANNLLTDESTLNEERLEIWIRPDGTSSKLTSTVQDASPEDQLSDLNKRFVLSFLHVHGKLFTKVGMDTFAPTVTRMLSELRSLLKRRPMPISSQRLLQLMAISMFSVHHTSLKYTHESGGRSLLQKQAIQVTLATVSALIERVNQLLHEHLRKLEQKNFISDEVIELLPPIKIWTDWMSCQKQVWCPPPPHFDFGTKGDVWTPFSELLTTLMGVELRSVKLLPTKFDGCEAILLPEDITLSGFIPLLGAPQSSSYIQPPYDKEKARACLRISRIQFFGDYLCGIPEPYLEFNVKKKRFLSLVPNLYSDDSEKTQPIHFDLSDNEADDIPTDSSSLENVNIVSEDRSPKQKEIQQLWSRQEELRRAQLKEEKIRQQLNAYLREEKKTRMVIQPRYLVPDTNCFIDHLNKLQCLIESKFYEVIIPLIVINELNGLTSRGSSSHTGSPFKMPENLSSESSEHQKRVGQLARKALDYLEKSFNEKTYRLKAITSKGSILDNINFRNESSEAQDATNDDLVLGCCLQFIKERPSEQHPQESGQVITIFRETVLLTEDRNLRVKALSQNVPVKSLPVFLQWANIP